MIHTRQAIRTRYHGPTNTRGSRISAKCGAGRVSVPYDHALNLYDNHAAAARALLAKLGWDAEEYTRSGRWHLGVGPDGDGFAVHAIGGSEIL